MSSLRIISALFLVCGLGVFVAPATAVEVSPLQAVVSARKLESVFRIRNTENMPLRISTAVQPWVPPSLQGELRKQVESQVNLEDRVLIYPPVATLQPGETQIFRAVLRKTEGPLPAYYEVTIGWTEAGQAASAGVGIGFGYSLPLFVVAPEAKPELHMFTVQKNGQSFLGVQNKGNLPAWIREFRWRDGASEPTAREPWDLYVFAQQLQLLPVPKAGTGKIEVRDETLGWVKENIVSSGRMLSPEERARLFTGPPPTALAETVQAQAPTPPPPAPAVVKPFAPAVTAPPAATSAPEFRRPFVQAAPPKPEPTAPPVEVAAPAKKSTLPTGWRVNMGSYEALDKAERELRRLTEKQFSAVIVRSEIKNKVWYRVQLAGYAGKAEALAALSEVRRSGYSAAWLVKPE